MQLKMVRNPSKSPRFGRRPGRSAPAVDGYALVFVKRLGLGSMAIWRVRDGPSGRLVLFLSRDAALAYAEAQLAGRRGQVIHE